MKKAKKVNEEFIKKIRKFPDRFYKDYKKIDEKMQNSNAIYKGSVIDYLYHPMFFDSSDINRFIELTAMMHTIVRKTVKEYLNNSSFRKKFNFSKEMEKLIKIDPGYSNPVPIARFDLFYSYDDKYKFCELNGDGSSAMNEANTVEEIVYKSEIINNLKNNYNIKYYELFYSWVDEIINIYRQFGNKEKPNVAIVDFEGLGTPYEFVEFKRAFQSCGYKTQIIDPRELSYKQNALYHGDFRIDLVYRRAVNREIVERINEVKDFIEAYRNRDVCVVGPFRSQIMHNKKFFSIISNESNTKYLNKDEKKFIRKHVPQTGILKDNDNLIEKIKGKKDEFVLKPFDLYAAKGVYIGRDFSQKRWNNIIKKILMNDKKNYLYQQFCNPGRKKAITFKYKKPVLKRYKTTLGLFIYNSKFRGLYSRLGRNNVIASREESIVAPNYLVK